MNDQNEKKVAWLAATSHLLTHGYMTLLPAVLVVLSDVEDLSFFQIGVIGTMGYLLYGAGSIPAGIMTDKFGAKRMLTIGLLSMAATSILVGVSPSGWFFAVAYALFGLSASIYHPSGLPLIAKHIEKKGKALGLHGVMGNIGLTTGPLFAALMVMIFNSWRAAYIGYGILGLAFSFVMLKSKIKDEADLSLSSIMSRLTKGEPGQTVPADDPQGDLLENVSELTSREKTLYVPIALLLLYIECVLFGFIYRGAITYFPTLFQQEIDYIASQLPPQPTVLAGILSSVILGFGVVGQWFAGYISDKVKNPAMAQIAIFVFVAPVLFMISKASDMPLVIYSTLFSLVFFGWQPLRLLQNTHQRNLMVSAMA
ncbi:MAG: MFS transporter [Nitrospirae bacterium]|nr:MFS transporter [Nitrospirota bacterium]